MQEASPSVELLSPIALHDAQAEVSYGFFLGWWSYRSRGLIAPIDWGQSIYHATMQEASPSVELLSPIALHDAQAEASYGFF